ncbi:HYPOTHETICAL PROTEIN MCJ_005050 [Mesomycoplasma conjunctivae]|uniref:Uncharacterized protein n=2 Tax=Mesomycoplasma conjunctivae TaxID=45361 RepID=C5J6U7_MESCH|nr:HYPOTHETICAL PROTEIN MCJ_005050 [Mesomycoplasma conjunctivae]
MLGVDKSLGKNKIVAEWAAYAFNKAIANIVIVVDAKQVDNWAYEIKNKFIKNRILAIKENKPLFAELINNTVFHIFIMSYTTFYALHSNIRIPFHLVIAEAKILKEHDSKISQAFLSISGLIQEMLLLSSSNFACQYEQLYIPIKLLKLLPDTINYLDFKKAINVEQDHQNINHFLKLIELQAYFITSTEIAQLPKVKEYKYMVEAPQEYFAKEKITFNNSKLEMQDLTNLRKLASGILIGENRKATIVSNYKINYIKKLIQPKTNYCIFYNFNEELEMIKESLSKFKIFEINKTKVELQEALKYEDNFIIAIQYKWGARGFKGLENKVFNQIYFSPSLNKEDFWQSYIRIYRPGQKQEVNFYYIAGKNSIELAIYHHLFQAKNFSLETFKTYIKKGNNE